MNRQRRHGGGPRTIRTFLVPEHCWVLPLDHANVRDPHALIDRGLADPSADERVAVRYLIEPVPAATERDVRALADRLQAERRCPPHGLRATVRHISRNVSFAVRRRVSFRRLRWHAPAVEQKTQGPLLTMQIHLWVQAATWNRAEARTARLVDGYAAYANARNRLRAHRPWRRTRFDRCFAEERPWPGATFVVSPEEAQALTGLPLLALATLDEPQVWTRWSRGDGRGQYATGPQPGVEPSA